MDLIIFIVLLVLVFILFIAADYLDVVLHVGAFALLFLLGVTIFTGALTYKTGESINTTYTYAASPFNTSINQSAVTKGDLVTTFTGGWSRTIGTMISMVSVLGFVLVYVHYGQKKKGDDDE